MLAVMTALSPASDARRRLSDHVNRCILAGVEGHLPIHSLGDLAGYVGPKQWQLTNRMEDAASTT
jgi:hypothetical protein